MNPSKHSTRYAVDGEVAVPIETAFAVAADIESYPRFVRGFRRARVLGRDGDQLTVRNEIGFGGAVASFSSTARFDPGRGIEVEGRSPTFGTFRVAWVFTAFGPAITRVGFALEASFRSSIAQTLFETVAAAEAREVLAAFRRRALDLHRVATRGRALAAAGAALLLACGLLVGGGGGEVRAQEAYDALAGHRAEADPVAAAERALRRKLFLEVADVERGTPGLSCDHLAARKPQAIAGEGEVVLVETAGTPAVLKLWFAPGDVPSPEAAENAGRALLAEVAPGVAPTRVVVRRFKWCR